MQENINVEIMYDHYKDSFEIITNNEHQRNKYFILLLILLGSLSFCIIDKDLVTKSLNGWLFESFKINHPININVIQSLNWVFLLCFTLRYFQICTQIDRGYDYLHKLEETISTHIIINENFEFSREGKSYLNNYPHFSWLVYRIYTVIFPLLYLSIISLKIYTERKNVNKYNFVLDCIIAVLIALLILLKFQFISKIITFILKLINKIRRKIKSFILELFRQIIEKFT